jgi:hypothetical protein
MTTARAAVSPKTPLPRRRKQKWPFVKGGESRFARGTYKGCTGWIGLANKAKKDWVWVVVDDQDYEEEAHTRVWKSSIHEAHKAPTTWAEAAIQQHPEIEEAIIQVSRLFATCNMDQPAWTSVINFIGNKISLAKSPIGSEIKKPLEKLNLIKTKYIV